MKRLIEAIKKAEEGMSVHSENKDKWKSLYLSGEVHTASDNHLFSRKPNFATIANDVDVADNREKTITFTTRDGKSWLQIDAA
jgi:hypothetical protein